MAQQVTQEIVTVQVDIQRRNAFVGFADGCSPWCRPDAGAGLWLTPEQESLAPFGEWKRQASSTAPFYPLVP